MNNLTKTQIFLLESCSSRLPVTKLALSNLLNQHECLRGMTKIFQEHLEILINATSTSDTRNRFCDMNIKILKVLELTEIK